MRSFSWLTPSMTLLAALAVVEGSAAIAQTPPRTLPDGRPLSPDIDRRLDDLERQNPGTVPINPAPPERSLPEAPLPTLPEPEQLLTPSAPAPLEDGTQQVPAQINVTRYVIEGSSVFSQAEIDAVTKDFIGQQISFSQLLQARAAITKLYVDNGYLTTGAFIPKQTIGADGLVKVQVLEGQLEDVRVSGTQKLHPGYVRRRLAIAAEQPLNVNKVLEGLRVLQLDPRLSSISADLQTGIKPGTSLLDVKVTEADPFSVTLTLDNGRSPSVGSVRRKITLDHNNLTGRGDELEFSFSNTNGSNGLDVSYTTPINPHNGTVRFAYGRTRSNVIEDPFEALDIRANSQYYEATLRQPIKQTSSEELALGLTISRQESRTALGFEDIGPFPLSPGANNDGETKVTALRFFQEWSKRSSQQVLAARSQFSVGTSWFGATLDEDSATAGGPDSRFFSWRGQAQWVRLLAPETLMLIKGDMQLGDQQLLPLEQFGIGGQNSVRGYRQDAILTDSGFLLSGEVRLPVLRIPKINGVLQAVPFIDVGRGWNFGDNQPDKQTLAGTGIGLLWRQGNNFSARFDWGIPLVSVDSRKNTWQERGLYFSVNYTPF